MLTHSYLDQLRPRTRRHILANFDAESIHVNLVDRITVDSNIRHGRPAIRGLRYPVETILDLLSSGMTIEEILEDYEDLEREDILDALDLATRLSRIKRIELTLG